MKTHLTVDTFAEGIKEKTSTVLQVYTRFCLRTSLEVLEREVAALYHGSVLFVHLVEEPDNTKPYSA